MIFFQLHIKTHCLAMKKKHLSESKNLFVINRYVLQEKQLKSNFMTKEKLLKIIFKFPKLPPGGVTAISNL